MAVRIDKDGVMRPTAPVTPIEVARSRRAEREVDRLAREYDAELRAYLKLGPARKGRAPVLPLLCNAVTILEYDRRWWTTVEGERTTALAWDDFRGGIVVRGEVPIAHAAGDDWSDDDESRVREWLQVTWEVDVKILDVRAAVRMVAMRHRHHSVRDYLEGLAWDGAKRLDRFLATHLSCEDSPWAELVGPKWMISAVARAYQPGCQVDTMLVLEGAQGLGKSHAVRLLAGDGNFAMELAEIGSRDAAEQLKGVWIYEIEEMESFVGAKIERVKKFISQPFDRHVGKWRVHAEKHMRGCVFIGTTNRADYLKDATGDRRFRPVRCVGKINLAALAADRDQLWAEAAARFKVGERWHLTGEEEQVAALESELRHDEHPWLERVRAYLDGKTWCQIHHVLEHLIGEHLERWGDRETKAVVECLLRLGWSRQRDAVAGPDGKRAMRYRPRLDVATPATSADDDGAEGPEREQRGE